jgi:hypothetical protein
LSHGIENPETVKARNARPDRQKKRSAQGNLWSQQHPEISREQSKTRTAKSRIRRSNYAGLIDDQRNPITVELDNVAITSDWHVPFTDEELIKTLFAACEEHGTKDLIIAGDFWDCDNYSRFTHLTTTASFKEEIEEVRTELKRLLAKFERIYICRGNHEKRWIDLNAGKVGMPELFTLARPPMPDHVWDERVTITSDDHIHLIHRGQLWLLCHPKNFRVIPLSVAQDLAAKNLCNVITAHGHTFRQGRDRSGRFRIAEGGGLFERAALDYQRETTCHPMTRSGFYILKDDRLIPYEGIA